MSKYSATGPAWRSQRLRVLERDGWVCAYCGKALVGDDATVDHIDAIVNDPDHLYLDHELVACCRTCNGRKQDKPLIRTEYRSPRWFPEWSGQ